MGRTNKFSQVQGLGSQLRNYSQNRKREQSVSLYGLRNMLSLSWRGRDYCGMLTVS